MMMKWMFTGNVCMWLALDGRESFATDIARSLRLVVDHLLLVFFFSFFRAGLFLRCSLLIWLGWGGWMVIHGSSLSTSLSQTVQYRPVSGHPCGEVDMRAAGGIDIFDGTNSSLFPNPHSDHHARSNF